MAIQVMFVSDATSQREIRRLGSFEMTAAPAVGDIVELAGVSYVVQSRTWQPRQAQLTVVLGKS